MMIDNIDFQQAINMKKKLFIDCFEQANQLSNAKQLPIMIVNDDYELVGMYVSKTTYYKQVRLFKKLVEEVMLLQKHRKNDTQ